MKIRLLALFALFTLNFSYAQNTFPNTGNVGIGTVTPNAALQIIRTGVNAGTDYPSAHITTSGTGSIYGPILYLNGSSGTGGRQWGIVSSGSLDAQTTGAAGNFAIYDVAAGSRMVITGNGDIGIGTTAPAVKLHVNGLIRGSNFFDLNSGVAIGQVGNGTMTGSQNVIAGYYSGIALTTGSGNAIIGANIANSLTTGVRNIIVGSQHNGFNLKTAQSLTTGFDNIMIGPAAGGYTTTGYQNVFMGSGAGGSVSTGRQNTELGFSAGLSANGNFNTFVGSGAGQYFNGDYNTIIGQAAGNSVSSGTSVTFIGAGAGNTGTTAGLTNATAIGYNTQVTASNSVILGNGANVGIGTTSPLYPLSIQSGTSPSVPQVRLTANGAGSLSFLNYAPDNSSVGFDTDYSSPGWVARHESVAWLYKVNGQLQINGSSGNVVGGPATGNTLFNINLANGNVSVGTVDSKGYKFAVNGSAIATSVTVKAYGNWPDYVFDKEYVLVPLSEVKTFIEKNHHLQGMPAAADVEKNGLDLGEINTQLTKKVEELTLYLIELKEENKRLMEQQELRLRKLEEKSEQNK